MRFAPLALMLVLAAASTARADGKRPAAVLRIVTGDTQLAKAADAVTATVRAEASAKSSDYTVVGAPDKVDAALLAADCDPVQPACAAKLGAGFSAEIAICGSLELRGGHQDLVLSLVDVSTKRRVRSVRQTAAADADAKKLARAAYTRLVGGDLGSLAVVANAPRGDVLIDGQVVAALFDGRTTLTNLVRGTHLLAIRASGYKPFEVEITVERETQQMFLLDPE